MKEKITPAGKSAKAGKSMKTHQEGNPRDKETASAYHKISVQEAREMIGRDGAILVDVRREDEHRLERIPGSILLPNEEVAQNASKVLPDRDSVLLVYCRSGHRSRQAALRLEQMGYRHVYDFGGILDWPYETEKP